MNLINNTIVITGGGSGIGRGLAEAFHALGNQVIIGGRRTSVLDEVTAANPGMKSLELDAARPESIISFANQIIDENPAVNVLINNAGITHPENLRDDEFTVAPSEEIITTNLLGPIRLTAAFLPHLLTRPNAAILNVTSGLAFVPFAWAPTYCATKAALHSYTQSLRYQVQKTGMRVIEIIPPYVQTELGGAYQKTDPRAMPLADYIAETMSILKASPEANEICVEAVKPLRTAEQAGGYDALFQKFNDSLADVAAKRFAQAGRNASSN